jgi:hypothetical protein
MSNRNDHSPRPLSAVKAGTKPFPAGLFGAGRQAPGQLRVTADQPSTPSQLAAFFLARRAEANFSRSGTRIASLPTSSVC